MVAISIAFNTIPDIPAGFFVETSLRLYHISARIINLVFIFVDASDYDYWHLL
jgi:hypothetical protein